MLCIARIASIVVCAHSKSKAHTKEIHRADMIISESISHTLSFLAFIHIVRFGIVQGISIQSMYDMLGVAYIVYCTYCTHTQQYKTTAMHTIYTIAHRVCTEWIHCILIAYIAQCTTITHFLVLISAIGAYIPYTAYTTHTTQHIADIVIYTAMCIVIRVIPHTTACIFVRSMYMIEHKTDISTMLPVYIGVLASQMQYTRRIVQMHTKACK